MAGFCRDCLTPVGAGATRCPACGGPRLLRHPELDKLTVAHLDCDAFYAAVEKRDDPSLADKPVIVGGGKRGVVSTACYVARIRGVHSAMPMFQALKVCPDAVVIRPNFEKYVAVSRQVRDLMVATTPLVEPLSIDEAFMELAGTERLHRAPASLALARLQKRIEDEIGITVSIGLSFNKFLAKVASDLNKPRGFSVIGEAEAVSFLADKPVGLIWGVGKAMQVRLAADGIRTIGALQRIDEAELARRYGSMGLRLARLSHARDSRPVEPARRGEEHQRRDDVRDGHRRSAPAEGGAEGAVGEGRAAAEAGRTGRGDGDGEAQDDRLSHAHAAAAARRPDATRRPHLRGRRGTSGAMRRTARASA